MSPDPLIGCDSPHHCFTIFSQMLFREALDLQKFSIFHVKILHFIIMDSSNNTPGEGSNVVSEVSFMFSSFFTRFTVVSLQ